MRAYVALTDNDWFYFLRSQPEVDEVNFWQPSGGRRFRYLETGEPFLFKLHSPENYIVGGGFFAHFSTLPHRMAWDAFGTKNGGASCEQMRRRIERFHRLPADRRKDYDIGCIILQNPFFFDEADWIPAPADFHPNISHGKGYDLTTAQGGPLWEAVRTRLQADESLLRGQPQTSMFAEPVRLHPRLGRGIFTVLVFDSYRRRCAVSGETAFPVLEVTHIRPVFQGGHHRLDNGILLRADLRRLFDVGYATITPDYCFRVSRRLREDFDDGDPYYQLDGQEVSLPSAASHRPRRQLLEWHSQEVFRG